METPNNPLDSINSLTLQPGQTLVYTTPHAMSADQCAKLADWFKDRFPANPVIVVDHGASLSILGENEQLTRIEQKLDHLIQALAEDEEPAPSLTLDGQPVGGERDQDRPL